MASIMVRGVYIRICNIPESIPTDYWKPIAKRCCTRDLITRSSMGEANDYYVEMTSPEPEKTEKIVAELISACEQVNINIENKDEIIYGYANEREPVKRECIIITVEYNRSNQKKRGVLGELVSKTLENYLDRISYITGTNGYLFMEEEVTPDGVYISMTHGFKHDPYTLPLDEPRYLMPNGRYITGRLSR